MEDLFLILGWPGPVGLGIFFVLLGTFIWLLAKADEVKKRTQAFSREKGLEKKKE